MSRKKREENYKVYLKLVSSIAFAVNILIYQSEEVLPSEIYQNGEHLEFYVDLQEDGGYLFGYVDAISFAEAPTHGELAHIAPQYFKGYGILFRDFENKRDALNEPDRNFVRVASPNSIQNQSNVESELTQPSQALDEAFEEIPDTIRVNGFVFSGATVFTHRELENVIKQALDIKEFPVSLSFSQLLLARSAVTEHYISQGFITSGAYIPEQSFNSLEGEITISIIEGRLSGINFPNENKDSRIVCLEQQVNIDPENPPVVNQEELLNIVRLLRVRNSSLLNNLNATLEVDPKNASQSTLTIRPTFTNPEYVSINNFMRHLVLGLEVNNLQSPSVGSTRIIPQITVSNPMGSDLINLSLPISRGSTGAELRLNFPVLTGLQLPILENENCNRQRVQAEFGFWNSRVVEEPFAALDIQSSSTYVNIRYRQEEILNLYQDRALGAEIYWSSNASSLLNIPFPLIPQANESGEIQLLTFRSFGDYSTRDESSVLFLRAEGSIGSTFDPNFFGDGLKLNGFLVFRGQAEWLRALPLNTNLTLGARSQFTIGTLPPAEKLAVGGHNSVRGYRENLLLFDNGILLSSELRFSILNAANNNGSSLTLLTFADFGTGWNNHNSFSSNFDISTLLSVGFGLSAQISNFFNSSLVWGIPLTSIDPPGNSLQDRGIYFSVFGSYSF